VRCGRSRRGPVTAGTNTGGRENPDEGSGSVGLHRAPRRGVGVVVPEWISGVGQSSVPVPVPVPVEA